MALRDRGKRSTASITNAMKALEKRFAEPVVQKMGDVNTQIEIFSSGRPSLDSALGGGWAVGKIHEIYAESGCGKTGLALEAIASVQSLGGKVAIIDAEHALNNKYCEEVGVDINDLYISQPSNGEQAFTAMEQLISSNQIDLIVVDSVSALTPQALLDGEIGEAKMAVQARMMSKGIRRITASANECGCTVIFINQLRKTMEAYGPSEVTTGGKALKYAATQRIAVKSKGQIKEGDEIIGFKQHIKVVKNKVGTPFKELVNDIIFGVGVDKLNSLVEAALFEEILVRKGAWYQYKGTNIAQGMKKLRVVLEDNVDIVEAIEEELKDK
jgi:recombination protein RecA